MTKRKKPEIRLGRLELQIMSVVWQRGKASVRDVKDALTRGRKPAYSTVLTMMRKLEAKGYLAHEVQDRTYIYHPTISRERVRHGVLGDLLDRLFEGSASLLLTSLVEQNRISEKELLEVQKLIKQKEKSK
jgi:predicted transcriptional regulator